jgi:hypothetical protein
VAVCKLVDWRRPFFKNSLLEIFVLWASQKLLGLGTFLGGLRPPP